MSPVADLPRFAGFPSEAVDFYRRLGADNTKRFWDEHKAEWERHVRDPMRALCAELEGEFGTFHQFRPHRDVRFSKDKSPYKTNHGAVTEGEGGELYYVHLDAEGLFVASGYYRMARDQLARYRAAVDDDVTGPQLEAVLATLAARPHRLDVRGRELSTAPRGYPRDHPRVALLCHKGVTVGRTFGAPRWLATRAAKERIAATWREAAPLDAWLNRHVGPSHEPPDERRR